MRNDQTPAMPLPDSYKDQRYSKTMEFPILTPSGPIVITVDGPDHGEEYRGIIVTVDTPGWQPTPDNLRINVNDGHAWNFEETGKYDEVENYSRRPVSEYDVPDNSWFLLESRVPGLPLPQAFRV